MKSCCALFFCTGTQTGWRAGGLDIALGAPAGVVNPGEAAPVTSTQTSAYGL